MAVPPLSAGRCPRHPPSRELWTYPLHGPVGAAQPLHEPPRPTIERPHEVHLHLHGVLPEDLAAVIECQGKWPQGQVSVAAVAAVP
jgi:hypothetical protein